MAVRRIPNVPWRCHRVTVTTTTHPAPALPGGYGRSSFWVGPKAPQVQRGTGCHILDEDGRGLIDANNNFAVLALGHANPKVVEAVVAAARDGTCFGLPHTWEQSLAEHIVGRIEHAEQVRFANSGTEAVMTAVRLARAVTNRDLILGFTGCYHGSSDVALAIKGGANITSPAGEAVLTIPPNDLPALEAAFVEQGPRLAAVLIDLLPNYAGFRLVDHTFVTRLRELCDSYGVLLLVDEVISFRLDSGGLSSRFGVRPDLTILGKLIGGGLPIGAIAGSEGIMQRLSPLSAAPIESSGTFTGNPISIRAGLACMDQFDSNQIAHINQLGESLLRSLDGALPMGWESRGVGSLVRISQPSYLLNSPQRHDFWWAAYRRGLLLMPSGLMALSTPMTEQTVNSISEAVIDAAAETDLMNKGNQARRTP